MGVPCCIGHLVKTLHVPSDGPKIMAISGSNRGWMEGLPIGP